MITRLALAAMVMALTFALGWAGHAIYADDALASYKLDQAIASTKLTRAGTVKTAALHKHAAKIEKEKHDATQTVLVGHGLTLASVRLRPQRDSGEPHPSGSSQAAPGCTGAELYREDQEFLAGEALRAELIRLDLKACYARLDRLAESLAE